VLIEDKKICNNVEQNLREYIHAQPIQECWIKKGKIAPDKFELVEWHAIEKEMKSSTLQVRHWIVKRAAQDCGANAILFKRRQRLNDECPFCKQPETVKHVYKCQHAEVDERWKICLNEFKEALEMERTDPFYWNKL
jgi:hypothetical protein